MTHWIAHLLGMNKGTVESITCDGKVYIGFKCRDCDGMYGLHEPFGKSWIPARENNQPKEGASE